MSGPRVVLMMKLVMVIAILASGFLPSVAASTLCLDKNPFMLQLKNKGVVLYSTALSSSTQTCSKEWLSHKTCCEHASLKTYAQKETSALGVIIQRVKTELQSATNQLVDAQLEIINIRGTLNKISLTAAIHDNSITNFRNDVQYLINPNPKLSLNQELCLNKTAALRTNSLCSICSGRSEEFFSQGKALMSVVDCKDIIDACRIPWKFMMRLVESMATAEKIMTRIKAEFPDIPLTIDMQNVRKLEDWLDAHRIRQELNDCQSGAAKSCPFSSAKAICENLLSLQKPTFFETAVNAIAADLPKINKLKLFSAQLLMKAAKVMEPPLSKGFSNPGAGGIPANNPPQGSNPPPQPPTTPTTTTTTTTTTSPSSGTTGQSKKNKVNGNTGGQKPNGNQWSVGRRLLEVDFFGNNNSTCGSGDILVIPDPTSNYPSCMDFNTTP